MNQRYATAILILLGYSLTGCQSLTPWRNNDKQESTLPRRLVALWSDSVYMQSGEQPTRGLGGRLYFYDENQQPVEVDGQLTVYAYKDKASSDGGSSVQSRRPDRKYIITPEQLTRHVSRTEFGPSYSIWIPWDQVGGEEEAVSVIPVFTDSSGKVIHGEYTNSVLAGKSPAKESSTIARIPTTESSIQKVSYETDDEGAKKEKRETIRATEIPLSPALRRRLMQRLTRSSGGGKQFTEQPSTDSRPSSRQARAEAVESPTSLPPRSRRLPSRSQSTR